MNKTSIDDSMPRIAVTNATTLTAKIGLVHGVTSITFYSFVNTIDDYFENGNNVPIKIPLTTLEIPEFKRADS